jgi:predicted DNA-binding protein
MHNEKIILSFQMPKAQYDLLTKLAEREDLTKAQVIRRALRKELMALQESAQDEVNRND